MKMPTAHVKVRALMNKWFGDPIDDTGPRDFIRARGYTITSDGTITPPSPSHTVSPYEHWCIVFLCDEWDYGFQGTIYQVEEMRDDVRN